MRPAANHVPSPISAPSTAANRIGQKDSVPAAIAEPAKSSAGTAGIGRPSRVNRTFTKTNTPPQVDTADDGNSTNCGTPVVTVGPRCGGSLFRRAAKCVPESVYLRARSVRVQGGILFRSGY